MPPSERRKNKLPPIYESLGKRIQAERRRRHWSQTTLGEKAGLRQGQVSWYENAVHPIPLDALLRLSYVLNIPVCQLLGQDHEDFRRHLH